MRPGKPEAGDAPATGRTMMKTSVRLKIADVVVEMSSMFPLERFNSDEQRVAASERFRVFYYGGKRRPDIRIRVEVAERLPDVSGETVFVTNNYLDAGRENWRLVRTLAGYAYLCSLDLKQQVVIVNRSFTRGTAILLSKPAKGAVWNPSDIIYDFLQVLMIHFLAKRRTGIFAHGCGLRDTDGRGFLFAGRSGSGKSTLAEIWHRHSKARVLNDDRIIVRKRAGRFFIYSSPWHGDYADYLVSDPGGGPLDACFFIRHGSGRNLARRCEGASAFTEMYTGMFPPFWDRGCLVNISSFARDLTAAVPSFRLGFVKDKGVIGFTRALMRRRE
jgi:hypothetical protein